MILCSEVESSFAYWVQLSMSYYFKVVHSVQFLDQWTQLYFTKQMHNICILTYLLTPWSRVLLEKL